MEDKTLSLRISTEPKIDNAYIRMVDSKNRMVLIGKSGGLFTYNRKGNKVQVDSFKVRYGSQQL